MVGHGYRHDIVQGGDSHFSEEKVRIFSCKLRSQFLRLFLLNAHEYTKHKTNSLNWVLPTFPILKINVGL
jgi:hypothetical protein